MRIRTLVGAVSTVVVFAACGASEQNREVGSEVEETPESWTPPTMVEVEETPPGPVVLPDIPFPVDENVVVHRHSLESPTFRQAGGGLSFHDEERDQDERVRLRHTHAIELEIPEGMLVSEETGRMYVIVPGFVLRTPEDHLFELLSAEYRQPDVHRTGRWRIETEVWGTILVYTSSFISPLGVGIYISSHPKPEPRSGSLETTHTEFNQPGGEGPSIEIRVWKTDDPTLKTYTLERGPKRDPMEFDRHRAYYRIPNEVQQ